MNKEHSNLHSDGKIEWGTSDIPVSVDNNKDTDLPSKKIFNGNKIWNFNLKRALDKMDSAQKGFKETYFRELKKRVSVKQFDRMRKRLQ